MSDRLVTHSKKRNRTYQRKFDHTLARQLYAKGRTVGELARKFGVTPMAVLRVVRPDVGEQMDKRILERLYEKRVPCAGGCGALVFTAGHPRATGLCRACYARTLTAADERPGELRCSKCDEWKSDDLFWVQRNRRHTRRGRFSYCKECASAIRRERAAKRLVKA